MMTRVAQLGIAIAALGGMVALMGLFPGVTGLAPTPGVGLVQVFVILIGFSILIFGTLIYVKYSFYTSQESSLMQQIGTRLAMTGMLFAIMTGLADGLGFGSHGAELADDVYLGPLQAIGVTGGYLLSAFGVLIYATSGKPDEHEDDETIDLSQRIDLVDEDSDLD